MTKGWLGYSRCHLENDPLEEKSRRCGGWVVCCTWAAASIWTFGHLRSGSEESRKEGMAGRWLLHRSFSLELGHWSPLFLGLPGGARYAGMNGSGGPDEIYGDLFFLGDQQCWRGKKGPPLFRLTLPCTFGVLPTESLGPVRLNVRSSYANPPHGGAFRHPDPPGRRLGQPALSTTSPTRRGLVQPAQEVLALVSAGVQPAVALALAGSGAPLIGLDRFRTAQHANLSSRAVANLVAPLLADNPAGAVVVGIVSSMGTSTYGFGSANGLGERRAERRLHLSHRLHHQDLHRNAHGPGPCWTDW